MAFRILNINTSKFLSEIIEDGKVATIKAKQISKSTGVLHQPRKIAEGTNWQTRELNRFKDNTYKSLPTKWTQSKWWKMGSLTDEHFAHHSNDKKGFIAFTLDAEKGERDIQTTISPGRFLTRFFDNVLSRELITKYATEFDHKYGEKIHFKIAKTRKAIANVYIHGPTSCMSGSKLAVNEKFHPAAAYAGPDLAVAYIVRNNKITARAVIWPKKKIFNIIYGDKFRLESELEMRGYKFNDDGILGARLQKIPSQCYNFGYLFPFIDGEGGPKIMKKYIKITHDYDDECYGDDGGEIGVIFNHKNTFICELCDKHRKEKPKIIDEEKYCKQCIKNHFVRSSRSREWVHKSIAVKMYNGKYWSDNDYYHFGGYCDLTRKCYPVKMLVQIGDNRIALRKEAKKRKLNIVQNCLPRD